MRLELNLALILMLLFATSEAATISVPGDYSSIQAAIDAAEDSDVIEVEGGVYRENVDVNKPLTLRGLGMSTVDAGGKGSAITLSADGITLEGFVATNAGRMWRDAGIKITLKDNFVRGNDASRNRGDGIYLGSGSNNTIFSNNASDNDNYGINFEGSSNNTVRDNQMTGNRCNFKASGYNDIDTSNLVNGKPIYYLVGAYDKSINSSSNAGVVHCIDCNNITVRGLTFKRTSIILQLAFCEGLYLNIFDLNVPYVGFSSKLRPIFAVLPSNLNTSLDFSTANAKPPLC